jgi:hypothetical protein
MTVAIERCLPIDIKTAEGMGAAAVRALSVSEGDFGIVQGVSWESRNRMAYELPLAFFRSDGDKLEQFEAFLDNGENGALPFWVREVVSRTHRHLPCGPLGDGSRTSFPLSCYNPSAVGVTVYEPDGDGDGVYYGQGGLTVHASANLLTDDQSSFVDGTTGSQAEGTCSISRTLRLAADGLACVWVTPTGAQADVGVEQTAATLASVDGSQEYTAGAWFKGAGSFYVTARQYDGTKNPVGTPTNFSSSAITGSTSAWVGGSVTFTTDASAEYVVVQAMRSTNSANTFGVDCLWLAPGDLDRWYLPSMAPGVIEMASAPNDGARLRATATGQRLARVMMLGDKGRGWKMFSPGRTHPDRMSLREVLEV